MSVRMALAKLCACTCGGAIIGGGAVHVAEHHPTFHHVAAHPAVAVHRPVFRHVNYAAMPVIAACSPMVVAASDPFSAGILPAAGPA